MKRKDMLKAAFDQDTPTPAQTTPAQAPPDTSTRVPSGAIRAMGLSLGRIEENAARAEALSLQLARGDVLQELDPNAIVPSFIDDRIDRTADPDFRRLVDSINQFGQQVPILVRPHPEQTGRYQVAYGHRRLSACLELGRSVKAMVRPLSDAELVIAQGKENAERRNLSFIERAVFAAHLEQKGFDRVTMQAALSVHPAEMSRLLAVVRNVPREVITIIGPAPRAGRPRWLELASLIEQKSKLALLNTLASQPSFRQLNSDSRFDLLISKLRAAPEPQEVTIIHDRHGRPVIKADHHNTGFRLMIDLRAAPGLDLFLLDRLPALIGQFAPPDAQDPS